MLNKFSAVVVILAFVVSFMSRAAFSQGFSEKELQALNEILEFADSVCDAPNVNYDESNIVLSGRGEAQLSGLLSKLTELGIEGAVNYRKQEGKRAILEKDIASAIAKRTDCKLEIWRDLKDRVVTPVVEQEEGSIWNMPSVGEASRGSISAWFDQVGVLPIGVRLADAAAILENGKVSWKKREDGAHFYYYTHKINSLPFYIVQSFNVKDRSSPATIKASSFSNHTRRWLSSSCKYRDNYSSDGPSPNKLCSPRTLSELETWLSMSFGAAVEPLTKNVSDFELFHDRRCSSSRYTCNNLGSKTIWSAKYLKGQYVASLNAIHKAGDGWISNELGCTGSRDESRNSCDIEIIIGQSD